MQKSWKAVAQDHAAAGELAAALKIPAPLATVLVARGFRDPVAAERFLAPRLSDLSDPMLLPGMEQAVDCIWKAIDGGKTIAVYGDYDADGITSTALLTRVLRLLGAAVKPFLPHRIDDGYGLSMDAFQRCVETIHPGLLVTVDCGTSSAEVVRHAAGLGVDVVVTDHHEPGHVLAPAVAVVNPKLGQDEGLKLLAGVGVAFKMCHALIKRARDTGRANAKAADLRDYLDLVAVGTIADIVPLQGENRILARHGLTKLEKTGSVGLRALMEVAGITGRVDAWHVGFMLGPRLNAAGRLGDAEAALELLLTEDPARARELAAQLDDANRERQNLEAEIVEQAIEQIDRFFDPTKHFGLAIAGRGWHPGVIGIVASRLVNRYYRPTVVVAMDDAGVGRGSCRSIEGFNLVQHLESCADLLVRFGGHKMAAGLEVDAARFEAFAKRFNEVAGEALRGQNLCPTVAVDAWISLAEADKGLLEAIDRMRPFGLGNPTPVWASRAVRILGEPRILKEKHLKMSVVSGADQREAIGFNLADRELPAGSIDVAFHLDLNSYMGRDTLQLKFQDFRPATSPD